VRLQLSDGRSYSAGFFRDPSERGGHWWDEPGMVIVQDLATEQVMAAVDEILRRGAIDDAFIPTTPPSNGSAALGETMLKQKRLLLTLSLLACVMLAGDGKWLVWPRTAITPENFDRIEVGMTIAEVEIILGGSARDDSGGRATTCSDDFRFVYLEKGRVGCVIQGSHQQWLSERCCIHIVFDDKSEVFRPICMVGHPPDESVIDTLRRWLRL
jgi:hypothetical protein